MFLENNKYYFIRNIIYLYLYYLYYTYLKVFNKITNNYYISFFKTINKHLFQFVIHIIEFDYIYFTTYNTAYSEYLDLF